MTETRSYPCAGPAARVALAFPTLIQLVARPTCGRPRAALLRTTAATVRGCRACGVVTVAPILGDECDPDVRALLDRLGLPERGAAGSLDP